MLDIEEFFNGVLLYQQSKTCTELLEEEEKTYAQNTLRSFPLTCSVNLENINATPKRIDSFSGCYSEEELSVFFHTLRTAFLESTSTTSLILNSSNHSISVSYDALRDEWIFIDANQLPGKFIRDPAQLATHVLSAFSANETAIFTTHAYVSCHDENISKQCLSSWKNNETWQNMHRTNPSKAQKIDSYGATWLYHAADEGYLDVATDLLKHNADPNLATENYYDSNPFCTAVKNRNVNMVKLMIENGADVTQPSLSLLLLSKKYNMIELLIRHGAELNPALLGTVDFLAGPKIAKRFLDAAAIRQTCNRLDQIQALPNTLRMQAIKKIKARAIEAHDEKEANIIVSSVEELTLLIDEITTILDESPTKTKRMQKLKSNIHEKIDNSYRYIMDNKLEINSGNIIFNKLINDIKELGREYSTHCCNFFYSTDESKALAISLLELTQTRNAIPPVTHVEHQPTRMNHG